MSGITNVILCHGRKHSIIKGLNYATAKFYDINEKSAPDSTEDLTKIDIPRTKNVDQIALIYCPNSMTLSPIEKDANGLPVKRHLRKKLFINIKNMLKKDGMLLMLTPFIKYVIPYSPAYHIDLDEELIEELKPYGFTYMGWKVPVVTEPDEEEKATGLGDQIHDYMAFRLDED